MHGLMFHRGGAGGARGTKVGHRTWHVSNHEQGKLEEASLTPHGCPAIGPAAARAPVQNGTPRRRERPCSLSRSKPIVAWHRHWHSGTPRAAHNPYIPPSPFVHSCASWLALGVRKRDVKAYNAKGQGDSRSWSRLDTFRPRGQPS